MKISSRYTDFINQKNNFQIFSSFFADFYAKTLLTFEKIKEIFHFLSFSTVQIWG